jgi:transcriptional regulator with XRE-family HTH domain
MPIAKLARSIGWNRSSLSSFLRRKTLSIQAHLLIRIGKGLNVSAVYLMTGGNRPNFGNSPPDKAL